MQPSINAWRLRTQVWKILQNCYLREGRNKENMYTNPSPRISPATCVVSPCRLASLVWTWLPCVHVMDAQPSWSTRTPWTPVGIWILHQRRRPVNEMYVSQNRKGKHCHNKPQWNIALVTVGFPAVKQRCCAEGAHAEAGTGPHTDRVRNALSRPCGSVCFSYHHTHWKWFRRKIPFLILTVHQRITLNSLMMHAHDVKADSR